ncbi:universal stress protein [Paracrocinitomix mangrovi]|uniref:universal stress protein n=1 Tax=Paracrocinitomix mangrovi TaxID=2862509 RepID=UPI001C8F0426|nr:universal stress protein [Paracrocinitomix mangrovi]UKN03261.1 universal stress protein [Paracrocinitomix mangrovi]
MEKRCLLVPHDFTTVADNALKYAMNLAAGMDANVALLHVVKDAKAESKAKAEFEKIISGVKDKPAGVELSYHIKSGSIFTDIASTASELKASLIIMGTHGSKGLQQKMFGSFALKVITSTHVPFLVVQDQFTGMDLSKIVVPLDETQESLQIEQVTAGLAEMFKSEVHVLTEKKVDANLKLKVAVHSGLISKQLKEAGIAYHTEVLPKDKGYSSDIVTYATKAGANLIAFAYHSDSLLPQFDSFAQNIITNKQGVPVLVVNSKEAGNYFF